MSDHSTDEIRDLLARAMTDAPEPHRWSDVEDRAARPFDAPAPRRRTAVWLAAAACTIALLGGLVAVVASDDEPAVRTDDPTGTTTSPTGPSTSAPTTTTLDTTEAGWTGGLLDDIDTNSLRPLSAFVDGDVVVPTAPSSWRVSGSTWNGDDEAPTPNSFEWSVEVSEAPPDNTFGQVLYVTQSRQPTCSNTLGCMQSGRTVTIDGVVWAEIVVERIPEDDPEFFDMTTLRAQVGDRWVSIAAGAPQLLTGPLLDNPPIIEFIEGLRAGSPDVLAAVGEACWQCEIAGAEGDPFAEGSLPDDDQTATTVEPEAQTPSGVSSDAVRPLIELAEGDIVVPTYVPPGLTVKDSAQFYEHPNGFSEVTVALESTDNRWANSIRLWDYVNDSRPLDPDEMEDPNHPPVEIAGLTWGWNDFETARVANIGRFSIWVYLHGLDRLEAERFIDGLRAVPIEEFPGQVARDGGDGLSVIDPDGTEAADVVASDERFELTAVGAGNQVCTKLTETIVPATMTFASNCWDSEMFTDSGVQDLYPLDPTDTTHLIIGVIDSPNATSVQITSPDGESVIVPTGPANEAIDGRFFLARLDLDASNGIRLDRFTIEDASP